MKVKGWVFALGSLLVLAGCRPQSGGEAKGPSGSGPAPVVSGGSGESAGAGTRLDPDGRPVEVPKVPQPAQGFEIKEGSKIGYKPAKAPAALSLGEKIDKSLASLDPAKVNVKCSFENGDDSTMSTPMLRLQDQDNYVLEYISPDAPWEMGRLVAKNGQSKMLTGGKFVEPKIPSVKGAFDQKSLDAWIDKFAVRMFDGYTGRDPQVWSKVISALKDPKNGYKTTVEEKVQDVNGERRPFYRVVARSVKPGQSEFEVVVDSKRFVPVTARSLKKLPDGNVQKMFWAADWKFGGKFSPDEFNYPGSD